MAYILSYLERRTGFAVRKVGEAHMVVPTGARMKEYRGMITINETGAFLFELIKTRKSTQDLIDALKAEYGIDDQTAFEAVESFVDQCNFANLLVTEEVEELPTNRSFYMRPETREQIQQDMKDKNEAAKAAKLDEIRADILKKTGKTMEEYVAEMRASGELAPEEDGSIHFTWQMDEQTGQENVSETNG